MTYEEALEEAKNVVEEYRETGAIEPFPYGLDDVYNNIWESALDDDPNEVNTVIKAFADHIMIYHSPLGKVMREEE